MVKLKRHELIWNTFIDNSFGMLLKNKQILPRCIFLASIFYLEKLDFMTIKPVVLM